MTDSIHYILEVVILSLTLTLDELLSDILSLPPFWKPTTVHACYNIQNIVDLIQYVIMLQAAVRNS